MTGRTRLEPILPFKRENNVIEKVNFYWENIPRIQLETDSNWWGNAVSDTKMGGEYYKTSDEPILADGEFLAKKSALAEKDNQYLLTSGIAREISAESRNPYADRVETDLRVVEKDAGRSDIVEAGNYETAESVFNVIQDTISGGPDDIINDKILGTTADIIQDR